MRKPIIDQWYGHLDKGDNFRVVAIDEDARTVEIQDFDGDVEEIDIEDWYAMDIEPIAPPEDWTGPMDDIERDDLGYSDDGAEKSREDRLPEPWEQREEELSEFEEARDEA